MPDELFDRRMPYMGEDRESLPAPSSGGGGNVNPSGLGNTDRQLASPSPGNLGQTGYVPEPFVDVFSRQPGPTDVSAESDEQGQWMFQFAQHILLTVQAANRLNTALGDKFTS